jgi:hypothetical protein
MVPSIPASPSNPQPKTDSDYGLYPLGLATESVNKALNSCSGLLGSKGLPALQSGEITFKTTVTTGWDIGISFFVLTLGFSHKHLRVTEVTIQYKKEEPKKDVLGGAFLAHPGKNKWIALEDELVKQIEAVAQATASTTTVGGLPEQQVALTVQFGIDWKLEGGIKTPTLVAVTADASVEKNSVHQVKLTFANPPKKA